MTCLSGRSRFTAGSSLFGRRDCPSWYCDFSTRIWLMSMESQSVKLVAIHLISQSVVARMQCIWAQSLGDKQNVFRCVFSQRLSVISRRRATHGGHRQCRCFAPPDCVITPQVWLQCSFPAVRDSKDCMVLHSFFCCFRGGRFIDW